MKKAGIIFLLPLLALCLGLSANAETVVITESLEQGAEQMTEALPQDIRSFLEQQGISPLDTATGEYLAQGGLFRVIFDFLRQGTAPFLGGLALMLALLILWAGFNALSPSSAVSGGVNATFTVALTLCSLTAAIRLITAVSGAVKACGVFMLSFLPIFLGLCASSGGAAKASASGGALILAAEVTVQIIAFLAVPVALARLGLSCCSVVSEISPAGRIANALNRAANYIMTFTFTVFLGLLSVQTVLAGTRDSLSLKTLKFMVGSFVPVAGSALSETVATLLSGIKILQSGFGVYGVVATALIVLPTIAEILFWRLVFWAVKTAAELLGLSQGVKTIAAIDGTLALLFGIILFVGALFIISLAVLLL